MGASLNVVLMAHLPQCSGYIVIVKCVLLIFYFWVYTLPPVSGSWAVSHRSAGTQQLVSKPNVSLPPPPPQTSPCLSPSLGASRVGFGSCLTYGHAAELDAAEALQSWTKQPNRPGVLDRQQRHGGDHSSSRFRLLRLVNGAQCRQMCVE